MKFSSALQVDVSVSKDTKESIFLRIKSSISGGNDNIGEAAVDIDIVGRLHFMAGITIQIIQIRANTLNPSRIPEITQISNWNVVKD